MSQRTLVVQLPPARGSELKARLAGGAFDFRPVPHSIFSVKGEGVVATFYSSGKLVVQGDSPELFVEHWIVTDAAPAQPTGHKSASVADGDTSAASIGSDECGKGDYFGPLVVAAVRLEAGEARELVASGVRDSKTLSDEQCIRLGGALRARYAFAVERLDPSDYNKIYKPGKLNELLADQHAKAIAKLARPGLRVLIDQFANARLMQSRLASLGVKLEQRPRAESDPAVAAASVIAREEFLTALHELSEEVAVDLHKGAGSPVDRAAERFVRLHGRDALTKVAKLHFKNTQKLRIGET